MSSPRGHLLGAFAAMLLLPAAALADDPIDFEKQILPILHSACFKCHSAGAKKAKGDIRLDDLAEIRAKSRSDNLVFPRKPDKSLLVHVISLPEGDEDIMPPPDESKPLGADQIALIRKWIEQGAHFGTWKSAARPRQAAAPQIEEPVNVSDVAATARRIDELIEANLTRQKRKPNPPAADDIWCRRVHLDLIGRIPTLDEMQAFVQSRDPRKRAKLIDSLLAGNGHVSTMFNYWCDALRARDELAQNVRGDFYLHFIKESIRANKPFDQWVREMVSPEGSLAQSPAVGYHLRDLGNRFANVDHTAIIFLGAQIGCAQCHDHPYDQWSRRDYHQFAAWTSAIDALRQPPPTMLSTGELDSVEAQLEAVNEKRTTSQRKQLERAAAMQIFQRISNRMTRRRPSDFEVRNGTQPRGQLPGDYQYPDGKPNDPIAPVPLYGEPKGKPGQKPAEMFAEWLTAPANSRFALTIANRMWTRIFGAPIAGAVESVREPEECPNPALASYLGKVMVAAKFDLRHFQRILANTRTYARQSGMLASPGAPYDFPGPLLRRMSAEQVWDSLMTLAVADLDTKMGFSAPSTGEQEDLDALDSSEELMDMIQVEAKEQAKAQLKAMRRPPRPSRREYEPAPQFSSEGFLRASELPQPAPESHFLRIFGQSNREIADGGWKSGTVPQMLLMLNSTLFDALVAKDTPFARAMKKQSGDSDRLRAAYLSIIGRAPTMEDTRLISSTLGGTGNVEAIAHTLLGTRQFLFIQ